jgi:hypothetical protein
MSLASLVKYNASNTEDAIDQIKDVLVAAGWTLHDDLSAATPYRYVLYSNGEDADEQRVYLDIYQSGNNAVFLMYLGWNNSTHVGSVSCGTASYTKLQGDEDGSFNIWVSATKDSYFICSYSLSIYYATCLGVAIPLTSSSALGILQGGVSSGSDVVVEVDTGESANFVAGLSYQIIDSASRQWVEVNAVDTVNDELTITTLSYDFEAGARIGKLPHRWYMLGVNNAYAYNYFFDDNGTGNQSAYGSMEDLLDYALTGPDDRLEKMIMWPVGIAEDDCYCGISKPGSVFLRCTLGGITSSEHMLSVGDIDSGTSSGSNTSTTLADTTKTWTTDEHEDKALLVTAGTGAGQFRSIASNTATVLTVSSAFETTPDATSEFVICEEGWLYFYVQNSVARSMTMRVI